MRDVIVDLSSWIIQDGNYPDFERGRPASFALEFHAPQALSVCEDNTRPRFSAMKMSDLGTQVYDVAGKIVHIADDWWVVDFGILAFREEKPPIRNIKQGSCVRGEISLAIDPYFYFEQLAHRNDAPALIYDWTIAKIEIQTAPLIEVAPKRLERDPKLLGWREIERTDAWKDDGEYRLHCRLADSPPRHSLRRR